MTMHPAETPSDDAERIATAAAEWFVERDAGLTPAQAAEFERWRQADSRHAVALAQLEAAAGVLKKLPQLRDRPELAPCFPRDSVAPAVLPVPARSRSRWFSAPMAAMAALIVIAGILAAWRRNDVPIEERFTAVQGVERVTLGEGSVLELNVGSEVRVRFTQGERDLSLVRGEVNFVVTPNPARPFVVQAGGVSVRAVGTAFNVKRGASAVEVLVTEGRVRVSQPGDGGAPRLDTELDAGQRLSVTAGAEPKVESISPEATRAALTWQPPLVFSETPLSEVVAQFNRRNALQLSLADPALGRRPVDGTFRAEDVEAFVRLMEKSEDMTVERPAANRVVLRSAR